MKEQLKFVQILRAFAVISVVLFHLDAFTNTHFGHSLFNFKSGFTGIDFFFALTGFIITYAHFKETQHHSSVKKFLLKRFVRIYPFYWLILLVIIGLESPEFHNKPTLRSTIDPTTFDGTINIIKNILLYPLPDSQMLVGIAWGLSHAIIFYLLFALGIRLGWKGARIIFLVWLLAIILNSLKIFPPWLLTEAIAGSVNIQILIGCVAGYLFVKNHQEEKSLLIGLSVAAIVIATAVFIYWKGYDRNNLVMTTLVGLSSSGILYYTASLDRKMQNRKSSGKYASPLLVLTGDAAYSIFLTHIIFIPYVFKAFNKMMNVSVVPDFVKNILIIIIFFVTIIAGILTYLLIERPLLNFLRKQFRLKRHKKSRI
jgi:exopolysaccharide production protein ExoZ